MILLRRVAVGIALPLPIIIMPKTNKNTIPLIRDQVTMGLNVLDEMQYPRLRMSPSHRYLSVGESQQLYRVTLPFALAIALLVEHVPKTPFPIIRSPLPR